MSNPKNKAVIGAFVVGAVVLAVVGVLILGGGEFLKKKITYIMFFDGSIKGLKVGAPVVFQGVEVGTVTEIAVKANTDDWTFKVPVIIELDPGAYRDPKLKVDQKKESAKLIKRGFRAWLELQSMVTGQLQIELGFKPGTKVRLVGGDLPYIEIPTAASGMEKFTKEIKDLPLKEVFGNLSATLSSIKDFVENPELKETVHNLNKTIQDVDKLVQHADTDLIGSAKQTIQHADQMVLDIDAKIKALFDKADKTLDDIDKLVVDVDKIIKPLGTKFGKMADSITATSDTARPAIKNVGKAFGNIESLTRKGSKERQRFDNMLQELSGAARSIKNWADYLERHPEALIRGKGGPNQRRR